MEYPEGFAGSKWQKRSICGVLSVALCAGVSYDVAHAACKQAMLDLKLGQRFRGGTYSKQRELVLQRLAVKFVKHECYVGMTVRQFVEHHAKPDVTYMVTHKGHVITVCNRVIADQENIAERSQHRSGGRKIIDKPVIEIIGKGW
jgi:hypothetical protein